MGYQIRRNANKGNLFNISHGKSGGARTLKCPKDMDTNESEQSTAAAVAGSLEQKGSGGIGWPITLGGLAGFPNLQRIKLQTKGIGSRSTTSRYHLSAPPALSRPSGGGHYQADRLGPTGSPSLHRRDSQRGRTDSTPASRCTIRSLPITAFGCAKIPAGVDTGTARRRRR